MLSNKCCTLFAVSVILQPLQFDFIMNHKIALQFIAYHANVRFPQEQRLVQSGLPQQHILNAPRINEDGCAKFADPEFPITPERVKITKQLI
jgi:hypothetical protein